MTHPTPTATIGHIIAASLRDHHSEWVSDFGQLRNTRHGWTLEVKLIVGGFTMRMAVICNIPLTEHEKNDITKAVGDWRSVNRELVRATALAEWEATR